MRSDLRTDIISTPCRRRCTVDPVSGHCTGCGRSLAEIAQWGMLDESARRAIMAELSERLAALTGLASPARTTA